MSENDNKRSDARDIRRDSLIDRMICACKALFIAILVSIAVGFILLIFKQLGWVHVFFYGLGLVALVGSFATLLQVIKALHFDE